MMREKKTYARARADAKMTSVTAEERLSRKPMQEFRQDVQVFFVPMLTFGTWKGGCGRGRAGHRRPDLELAFCSTIQQRSSRSCRSRRHFSSRKDTETTLYSRTVVHGRRKPVFRPFRCGLQGEVCNFVETWFILV